MRQVGPLVMKLRGLSEKWKANLTKAPLAWTVDILFKQHIIGHCYKLIVQSEKNKTVKPLI